MENENINETNSSPEEQGGQNIKDELASLSAASTELTTAVQEIRAEIGKIVVGQQKMVDLIITAILANGHILIEGVPGVAKTLTAKLVSQTIDAAFSRIQFTPDLMPSDVLGTSIYNPKSTEFEFKSGPIFANVVLIDEINRAPAKTQAALFECMEEHQVTIDGVKYKLDPPFIVLATQNPVEQEGTYRLPEAQLDRFMFKIEVDYPEVHEEFEILKGNHARKGSFHFNKINAVLSASKIASLRGLIQDIHIDDPLIKYIAQIISKTRSHPSLFLGASPRASIALLNASKAMAAIRGRSFVTPEDIKELATPILTHRIAVTPEKEMEGIETKEVIKEIVEALEIPR